VLRENEESPSALNTSSYFGFISLRKPLDILPLVLNNAWTGPNFSGSTDLSLGRLSVPLETRGWRDGEDAIGRENTTGVVCGRKRSTNRGARWPDCAKSKYKVSGKAPDCIQENKNKLISRKSI
jgi:hypothetical protein